MNEVKKRETTSIYEQDGRKFVIHSYDPMEGNYFLSQILAFVLPFGIGKTLTDQISGSENKINLPKVESGMKPMSKEDFMSLQRDILMTIEEQYESGNTSPVVRDNGTYGIDNITMGLVLNLLIASLAFNFKDFFAELPSVGDLIKE